MKRIQASLIFMIAIVFSLAACSRSERAVLDQSQSYIDHRQYSEAINLLEKEIPDHPDSQLKTQLAYAYLGRSGVELLEIANQVTFLKSFKSVDMKDQPLDKVCPQIPDTFGTSLSYVCLPIIKLSHFPEPDHPDLQKALSIFNEINPDPATTDHDINLLIAIVQMGMAIKDYDHLVMPPEKYLGNNLKDNRALQIEAASYSIKYLKQSFDSLFACISRLLFSYDKIKQFMSKYEGKPLVRIGHSTYSLTDHFSADNFLQFFTSSLRSSIAEEGAKEKEERGKDLKAFASNLEKALYNIRFQLNGLTDGYLDNALDKMLESGVDWVPQNIDATDLKKIDFNNMLHFPTKENGSIT